VLSRDEIAAKAREFNDRGFSGHDLDYIEGVLTDDFIEHNPFPGQPPGREGAKHAFQTLATAFPDLHHEIHAVVADGDEVAVHSTLRGTHQGEFMGTPATGKEVAADSIDIVRFADGLMVEHWGQFDAPALLMQIGAMPAPGS